MKNQHLIPANVLDIVQRFNEANETEKLYLLQRIEAINQLCSQTIAKFESRNVTNVKKTK